jgi:hypothetical protein
MHIWDTTAYIKGHLTTEWSPYIREHTACCTSSHPPPPQTWRHHVPLAQGATPGDSNLEADQTTCRVTTRLATDVLEELLLPSVSQQKNLLLWRRKQQIPPKHWQYCTCLQYSNLKMHTALLCGEATLNAHSTPLRRGYTKCTQHSSAERLY